jgi:ABC-type sulfate/molybdate transport systems ATPase subunit
MDEPQEIDLHQLKYRRELTDRLEDVIRESQGNTFAVTHDFMPLFPGPAIGR